VVGDAAAAHRFSNGHTSNGNWVYIANNGNSVPIIGSIHKIRHIQLAEFQ